MSVTMLGLALLMGVVAGSRSMMAAAFGNDHRAAFVEDALAMALAAAAVMGMR